MVRFLNPERWVCPNEHNHENLRIRADAEDRRREGRSRGAATLAAKGTPEERHARAVARGRAAWRSPERAAIRAEKTARKKVAQEKKAAKKRLAAEKKAAREKAKNPRKSAALRERNQPRDPATGKFVKKRKNGRNGK